MGDRLEIERKTEGEILRLKLKGNITEDSAIEELAKDLKPTVIIDLEQVARINSYGIRQWVNMMKRIRQDVLHLVFVRCPPAIVEQFNMISNFGGGGTVFSFQLPYHCDSCDRDELRLFELPGGESPLEPPVLPEASCSQCQKAMSFNDIEDEYFYFLQHQKGKTVDPALVQRTSGRT